MSLEGFESNWTSIWKGLDKDFKARVQISFDQTFERNLPITSRWSCVRHKVEWRVAFVTVFERNLPKLYIWVVFIMMFEHNLRNNARSSRVRLTFERPYVFCLFWTHFEGFGNIKYIIPIYSISFLLRVHIEGFINSMFLYVIEFFLW